MRNQKTVSLMMSCLWALCLCHGLMDLATMHWVRTESGNLTHHHHDPIHESSTHRHADPVDGHSHDTDGEQCCDASVRLVSADRQLARHAIDLNPIAGSVLAAFHFYLDYPVVSNLNAVIDPILTWLVKDLRYHLQSLIAPNSPPIY